MTDSPLPQARKRVFLSAFQAKRIADDLERGDHSHCDAIHENAEALIKFLRGEKGGC